VSLLLLHLNILYTQHTTHQLKFVEGGKPEHPEKNPTYLMVPAKEVNKEQSGVHWQII
jgi:hypothetical protein